MEDKTEGRLNGRQEEKKGGRKEYEEKEGRVKLRLIRLLSL